MTTWLPRPAAAAAVGATLLLAAAAAYAQLPTAEQRAFDGVDNAISAFESASGRGEMTRAAGQIIDAAERALNAFAGPDSARDAAAHVAANRAALDALGRAGRTLSTAAGRLTDDYYPATRAAEVTREAAALDRAVAAAADPEATGEPGHAGALRHGARAA